MANQVLRTGLPLVGLLLVAACFAPGDPARDDRSTAGIAPSLLPLSELLAQTGPGPLAELADRDLSGRVAALQARAAGLRAPVIPPQQRQRMLAMFARHR